MPAMELTIDQALEKGIAAHKEGKLQEAERLYRTILKTYPTHPDSNHNMGVLAVSVGNSELALSFFKTALQANPNMEQFWVSYIDTLISQNQISVAKEMLEQGIQKGISSKQFDTFAQKLEMTTQNAVLPQEELNKLFKYYQNGQYHDAEKLALSITQKFPNNLLSWKVLGAALKQTGKLAEALEANEKVIKLSSGDAESHYNMGNTLQEIGRLDEAEAAYRSAITINSSFVEAYNNLGNTLRKLSRLEEAEANYVTATELKSDHIEAQSNLALTLRELGKLKEAEKCYKGLIDLQPNHITAHNGLGVTLTMLNKLSEAEACYETAINLKPDYVEAFNNLGVLYRDLGRLDDAEANYKVAIILKPNYTESLNNLGHTLQDSNNSELASRNYRRSICTNPAVAYSYWNLCGLARNSVDAEYWIDRCLGVDSKFEKAIFMKAAQTFYQGDKTEFDYLLKSQSKSNPYMSSLLWLLNLPKLPPLYYNRWHFFDAILKESVISRPFYEFGVWRGASFKYLIKTLGKGFGFDTFTGLPEEWDLGSRVEGIGKYTSEGSVPNIDGGEFIAGKFEDTLPIFFSKPSPIASIINFDADLYSSTILALIFSKTVIDKNTILIFDEFIINENWEQHEFKALNDFCLDHCFQYEVIAVSLFTKQVAVKLIKI